MDSKNRGEDDVKGDKGERGLKKKKKNMYSIRYNNDWILVRWSEKGTEEEEEKKNCGAQGLKVSSLPSHAWDGVA